ncbi:hypothetical protein LTR05_007827 [Lithohypha guttulata]|uniref:Uncharacterized protein n=1 Tax=Lithohypha guttulata TaxID=1690604 RepID=A0AAN7SUF9_9EURO|nr:hypothetical protein LTR05_007827 [Lithohypha guttulata]
MSTVVWHTKLARTLVQSALFKAKKRTILWQYKPPVQSSFSACCQLGRQQECLTTNESDRRMEKLLNRNAIRPAATWLSATGRDVNIDQILRQLPRIDDDVAEAYPALTKTLTSAVFLVTPGLAHLFDGNNEFFKTAMNQIFQGAKEPFQKQFRRYALVAIVDAVPAISLEPENEKSQMHGYEGLGVCLLPTPRTVEANGEASSDIPIINLVMHIRRANGNPTRTFTYSAPVANTLFVNGHKHTMSRSDWDSFDGAPYLMTNRQELTELDVPLYRSNISEFVHPRFVAKLEELTEPCIIVSSMGNIVRQLQTQAGEIISASSELEKIIPPLVKKKDEVNAGMQLDIFALVYPQTSSIPTKRSKNAPTAPADTTNTQDVHKLLLNKARFHKVTSGGGGWGKKAGLLSLEPGIELRQSSQQEDSLFAASLFELDEVEMPRSEVLCPPGHIIQFLAKWTDTNNNIEDAVRIEKLTAPVKWSNDDYFQPLAVQKFSVGTVRLPETVAHSHSTTAGTDRLVFCPNQFGFLASSGMSFSLFGRKSSDTKPLQSQAEKLGQDDKNLEQSQEDRRGSPMHSTLVQVPNSYIVNVARAGGRLRIEDGEDDL